MHLVVRRPTKEDGGWAQANLNGTATYKLYYQHDRVVTFVHVYKAALRNNGMLFFQPHLSR